MNERSEKSTMIAGLRYHIVYDFSSISFHMKVTTAAVYTVGIH